MGGEHGVLTCQCRTFCGNWHGQQQGVEELSQTSLPFFGFSFAARAGGVGGGGAWVINLNKSRKGNEPIIFFMAQQSIEGLIIEA